MKKKEPSKVAVRLAKDMAAAFDALQKDWIAVVVILRRETKP